MRTSGATFKFDRNVLSRLGDKIGARLAKDDRVLEKRMETATRMVWQIAHQRRPYISKQQMKAQGRTKRVSDPSAQLGVPVQKGTLQGSVQRKVTRGKQPMSFIGEVYSKGVEYAGYIEYGTSKMAARPFMRPAINLTRDAIKRMFGYKVESNL